MIATRPPGRRARTVRLAVLGLMSLSAAPARPQTEASRQADAMVFIRVVGDLRVVREGAVAPVVRRNVEIAVGSGFVIASSGLVLTSRHVVEVEPEADQDDETVATVEGGRIEVFVGNAGAVGAWEAHVVASDAANDLAALQLTAADLPYLPLGDSDAIEPGRPVRVLGFPFGRQTEVAKRSRDAIPQVTVTAGSLSAAREDDRGETRFLQTDAEMHPGNSGGPMLDEDGYVIGVVRMKLSQGAHASGAGFTVPANVVKDFLEANGLLDRLPSARLRPGVRHTIDWKQLAVDLPEGFGDRSPSRVLADGGELADISLRIDRWETPWPASGLEEALLGGQAVPGFIPAPATPRGRGPREPRPELSLAAGRGVSVTGSATGSERSGAPFRVEYAIVDLGREKVVARYLGPADAVAFNLGLLRRSLRGLEAAPLLFDLPRAGALADGAFEAASFTNGEGAVAAPRAWSVREPATHSACEALPPADAGLLARHPADYTLVLRALRFSDGGALARRLARCDPEGRAGPSGYAFRFERLGVPVAVRGVPVSQGGAVLLLEQEAPVARLPVVEGLFERWVAAVAAPRAAARYPVAP